MTNLEYSSVVKIKVFGIGGGGCNAVNRMVTEGVKGAEFFVVNTDVQSLNISPCKNKYVLGKNSSKGLGAGGNPENGRLAAEESVEDIKRLVADANMVFITAGMGGGTGTGAAPIFAKIAKEAGALTVAIVTTPFEFEGQKRANQAKIGLEKLKENVDSLIVVSNNKLLKEIGKIPLADSFREADNVLRQGVQTITDLIAIPAFINLDFADIESVMKGKGTALIGIGMAKGENKAQVAAEAAIKSPLLDAQIKGAKAAVINVTGGPNVTAYDASIAVNFIKESAGSDIENIIFGVAINENLDDNVIVTIIATGFDLPQAAPVTPAFVNDRINQNQIPPTVKKDNVTVDDDDTTPIFFKNF